MTSTPRTFPQHFFQPDEGSCQILLVRHGQSAALVEGQTFPMVDGQGDPPLSELGEWQSTQAGLRLSSEPIDAIYASSLQRTSQTAKPLAERLGLPVAIDPDLREVHLGEGEGGKFRIMVADGHPAAAAMRAKGEWGEIPGAETNEQLRVRTVRAVERIAAAHTNQLVAVFCHGGVIGSLLGHAASVNPFLFSGARNASINHLVIAPDRWIIRLFNDGAHTGSLTADADPPT